MAQTRSISYDDIMIELLPLAQRIISKFTDKKSSDVLPDEKSLDKYIQKIMELADDVKTVKNAEKDSDRLTILKDAGVSLP